jgi:hypothetical protein
VEIRGNEEVEVVLDPVIAKANEEVELFETALEPFCKNELSYNAIRSSVIGKTYALMDALNEAQAQAEETAAITNSELSELSQQIEDRDAIISGLRKELFEAKELAEDNANKRDAAYREVLEASQTIDALKDKLAATEITVPKTRTNVEGPDVDAAEKYKQSLPAIYDVTPLDMRQSKFKAKFAETDEEFEDYYLYKNAKYREVSAEQAVTFRTEYLDAQQPAPVEEDHSYDIPDSSTDEVAYTAPAFRGEDENAAEPGLAAEASTVAGSPVTREEFEELKARVDQIASIRSVA